MKKILILGGGGSAGILLTRCLKKYFYVEGQDDGKYAGKIIEAEKYEYNPLDESDLVIPVPDNLVLECSEYSSSDDDNSVFLPPREEVELCQDKAKCAEVLGDLAPKTLWVRDTKGAGGKGSQMCSEYLPGRNLCTELLYKEGELYGSFQKERISYEVKERTQKVSGSAKVATCIRDNDLMKLAIQAVDKVSKKPHGVYSVDFKENKHKVPKVTEINAGRFVTSSYVFYYKTRYNLPRMMVELALDLPLTKLGKYPEGKTVIRQTDSLPWIGEL